MLTNAPRGTKDILPSQIENWNYLEEAIQNICCRYGYEQIRTPIFEHTELFQRGIGEGTDVVDKEMYTFTDRGGRSITLRPENTAAVVRAYLQNKLFADKSLVKLFYCGSMFRYDRPQAGRLREFHQFGIEALGEKNAAVDAEVILLAVDLFSGLGFTGLTTDDDNNSDSGSKSVDNSDSALMLKINTVGCPKCRPVYRQKLQHFFSDKLGELCHDCQSRFEKNPMRILDCKADADKEFMQDAPKIKDCLCDDCREHFQKLQQLLNAANVKFTIDDRLVRGLDYYTKTAFEIQYPALGAQSAIAGGGRYDGLIEEIGGNATPAVGFAAGLERVLAALEMQHLLPEYEDAMDAFIVALGEDAEIFGFEILTKLRHADLNVTMDFAKRSMKAQMKQAAKSNAHCAVIIGEDEVKDKIVTVKNLKSGQQKKVKLDDLSSFIKRNISNNNSIESLTEYINDDRSETVHAYDYYNRGIEYLELEDYQHALEDFTKALEIDPKFDDAQFDRGKVYMILKDYQKAYDDFYDILNRSPDKKYVYYFIGDTLRNLRKYEQAQEYYDEAIKTCPQLSEAYRLRGRVFMDLKQYDKAIEDFSKAIELDEISIAQTVKDAPLIEWRAYFYREKSYKYRAECYEALGDTEKAKADFEKYEELTAPFVKD